MKEHGHVKTEQGIRVTKVTFEMASSKLSQQEKKDLEKFTKFLIYKSLQIIVQSRLGEKIKTKSKPYTSGADWVRIS